MLNRMLRVFGVLAAIVLMVTSVVCGVGAADVQPTLAVATTDFYVRQGDTFTTTLYIPDGANIVDFDITLRYDADVLSLQAVEEHEDIKGAVLYNDEVAGEIAVNYTRTKENVTKYLPVLNLTFVVDENVGVGVYDCLTVDEDAVYMAHRLVSAGVLEAVDFTCSFAKLTIYEMGDVDLNSSLDIADATHLRRYLAELECAINSDFQLSLADTYYDGEWNVADAVALQRRLARKNGDYGDRVNVSFVDANGAVYAKKSVLYDGTLHTIPAVPAADGFENGMWSLSADEYVRPVYTHLTEDVTLYAYYDGKATSEAVEYYKRILTDQYYSGDLPTNLSSDLSLWTTLYYQDGYYANLIWSSDCSYVLNSTTGYFTKPTYPQEMSLTARIISYDAANKIEAEDSIVFNYLVPGEFITPTKAEVADWIRHYFTDADGKYRVNYDVKLVSKLNNTVLPVEGSLYDNFEIRLAWYQMVDGVEVPISRIQRTTAGQVNSYVAVATFNGKPLDGDGKIYVDNVEVTAIEQMEIRNHIIQSIAANMGTLATDGTELWNDDAVYGATVRWETGNADIAYVANNVVQLKADAVTGSTLPLNARVSYAVDGGVEEFILSYNLTVSCDNTYIQAPQNMDENLYKAIKEQLEKELGYRGDLTSAALANVQFVNLDLSDYGPGAYEIVDGEIKSREINSLRGLSYCKHLRTLNISGLHIVDGTMNQIATLSYLEAFIARDCGLDNLSDGGTATLRNATGLKMLDLTNNRFTSLDSVFDQKVRYGSLREVYLSNNCLTDINALQRAPMVTYLSLANNGLTTEGTAAIAQYPYLQYLSLAYNQIDSVEHLTGLKHLTELRLHNNLLTDVRALRTLVNLEILYLGHNRILDVGFLNTLTALEVLYVNDNAISDVSALTNLSKLEIFNVSNNSVASLSVLRNYKDTLTELYAENNRLTDFSFINGATNLHILMLAGNHSEIAQTNMSSWLAKLSRLEVLTLSDVALTDLAFLSAMNDLARLDVANCGLDAFSGDVSNIEMIADRYATLRVLNLSNNDMRGHEEELLKLRNLSLLTVLFMDNVCDRLDAYTLTYSMPELAYISMENCGIQTIKWLFKYSNLVYVDVAGNDVSSVNFETDISNASIKTLEELYLDTNVPCVFANAYRITDFGVKKLSLAGVSVETMERLPYLEAIEYLNLSNTGLTSLSVEDEKMAPQYSILRYDTVKTLDVSHLEADIALVEQLPNLKTVYAVGAADSRAFYEDNLHTLQRLYNKGVACYLYDHQTVYQPVASAEGKEVLNLLDDLSCDITVAADNVISDNSPYFVSTINDFDVTWTVSNADNYEIVGHRLAVKSYEGIEDETLIVTAQITVYPDQEPVCREFVIRTHVLRVSADYLDVVATGYSEQLTRDKTFVYDVQLKAAATAGFSVPVKPVEDCISYSFEATFEDGSFVPYNKVLSVLEDNTFAIATSAPLHATAVIAVDVTHEAKDGTVVQDMPTLRLPVTVVSRTFTVMVELNGGTLTDEHGVNRDVFERVEDDLIFHNLTVGRVGYIFEGWYLDAAFTQLFSKDGVDATMPMNNVTLYAKWKAHSFNLSFDANGGTVDETSRLVLCDTAFGDLPTPQRTGYTFKGWFVNGALVTADSAMATAEDVVAVAQWELIPYTVSWNNGTGYTIVVTRTDSPNAAAAKGTLKSGATVYYGDVLSVSYTRADYYHITQQGQTGITVTGNVTSAAIYAKAEPNEVSGWVKASEVPAGAQIENSKWIYTLREYTSSANATVSGWTKYDTKRTSWGAWSAWSTTNPTNGSRNVESRTEYHYYRWTNGRGVYTYKKDSSYWLEEMWTTSILPTSSYGKSLGYVGSDYILNVWARADYVNNYSVSKTFTRTAYRYQEPVYTYYFYRDLEKEATSDPTGQSNTSNVVKWVRYRAK